MTNSKDLQTAPTPTARRSPNRPHQESEHRGSSDNLAFSGAHLETYNQEQIEASPREAGKLQTGNLIIDTRTAPPTGDMNWTGEEGETMNGGDKLTTFGTSTGDAERQLELGQTQNQGYIATIDNEPRLALRAQHLIESEMAGHRGSPIEHGGHVGGNLGSLATMQRAEGEDPLR
jgi:hypothetical protein